MQNYQFQPSAITIAPASGPVATVFQTDFNIPAWTQGGGSNPLPSDDAITHWGDWTANGKGDEITLAANRPGSAGLGFRHYRDAGTNQNGGGLRIVMPSGLTKMWVRFYMRYSPGFTWANGKPSYTKDHYWNAGGQNFLIFGHQGGAWGLHTANGSTNLPSSMDWLDTPAGQYHCFEYHADQAAQRVMVWVNGVLGLDQNVNLGSIPWNYFVLGSNQNSVVSNGYTDYDDVAVSTQGRIGP